MTFDMLSIIHCKIYKFLTPYPELWKITVRSGILLEINQKRNFYLPVCQVCSQLEQNTDLIPNIIKI